VIDFRYHLVSIASIFMALAVGIVLGAGPLKEDIGNTLTSEVTKLREDKTALRAELDQSAKQAKARDDFTAAGNRALLADRLEGITVTLVALPGSDANLVRATGATLTSAGANIGSTVTLLDAWTDPDKQAFRATLAEQLAPAVGLSGEGGGGELIDQVLARALLTRAEEGGDPSDGAAEADAAIEGLRTGELVSFASRDPVPAQAAVVVAGPLGGDDAGERSATAASLSALAAAFDRVGGTVVVSASSTRGGGAEADASLVEALRKDESAAKSVSTVDNAELPMGQASVVFALLEQLSGKAGQYGLGENATAAFPDLTAG
jgi:hypothetical protein